MSVATVLGSTTLNILDFISGSNQSTSSLAFKRIAFIELKFSVKILWRLVPLPLNVVGLSDLLLANRMRKK